MSLGPQRLTQTRGEGKKRGVPNVRGWNYPGGPPPPRLHCLLPAHPSRPGTSGSVEHDGLGILVCHLSHVTKDIFFCDNTKQPPVGRERAEKVKRKKRVVPLNNGQESNVRLVVNIKADTIEILSENCGV